MMLQIFLNHFLCYVATTPCSITDTPEMATPISLAKLRELRLNQARGSAFDRFHQMTYTMSWPIFKVKMYMIPTYYSRKNFNILCITDLTDQFPATNLDISAKNVVPILRCPDQMNPKARYAMANMSVAFYLRNYLRPQILLFLGIMPYSIN